MAFNPFHSFRKHQRVILSVVTIALMVTFGLTWGAGDITRYFGGATASTGPLLTTFKFSSSTFSTSTAVYEKDYSAEVRRRRLANSFTFYVVQQGTAKALDNLRTSLKPKAGALQTSFDPIDVYVRTYDNRNNPTSQPPPLRERAQQIQEDMQRVAKLRQNPTLIDKDQAKADKLVKDADIMLAVLRYEMWETDVTLLRQARGDRDRDTEPFYFGGSTSLDDTLDFMLWKHQAKKLGIEYTPNDVRKGLNRLIGVGDTFAPDGRLVDNSAAAEFFKAYPRFKQGYSDRDVKELEEALADEFAVQTAQVALLGEPSSSASSVVVATGIYQPTTSPTPDEFLEYYRDKRTTLKVAMLEVPVKNFIDTKEEPPENKLQDLYNRYHSAEPNPERSEPAFKIPRKVRVEYASGDPEAPVFMDQAKVLALHPAVLRISAFASGFPAGGGAGWALAVTPALQDDPLMHGYHTYQQAQETAVRNNSGTSPAVYDRSFQAASTVADLLGNLQQGSPLGVAATQFGADAVYQTAAARTAGTVALLATDPSPFTLGALTRYPALNSARPLSEVAGELLAKDEKAIAQAKVGEALEKIQKELEKIGSEPDATEKAKLYLEDVGKQYGDKNTNKLGIRITGMTKAEDRYAMLDDPFFKPLNELFDQFMAMMPQGPRHSFVDDEVMPKHGTYHPFLWQRGLYTQDMDLVWFAEDIAAHEVPYAQARPEVIAAQRLIDARQNALIYLNGLTNKELKDKAATWPQDSAQREQEVKAYLESLKPGGERGRVFELNGVARLVTPDTLPNPGLEVPYYAYSPPKADLPQPPANFVDRLMTMEKPGDVVFVKDRPQKTFYVAVLLDRAAPTLDDFRKMYQNSASRIQHDPLWDNLMAQRRQEFQKQFIRRMREEATGDLDKEGRINVPPDIRGKFDKSER